MPRTLYFLRLMEQPDTLADFGVFKVSGSGASSGARRADESDK